MFDFSGFFAVGVDAARALPGNYNLGLVLVSYLIASLGAYAFLQFAGRIVELRQSTLRWSWLAGGALAMGLGIWAMHFVGMLAHVLPIPVTYDGAITALSAVPAILAAAIALHIVARPAVTTRQILIGGTLMGAGIGAMHYTGMASMQLDALVRYDPLLFGLSVLVAIVLAIVALQVRFWIDQADLRSSILRDTIGALILGFAVSAMHYTAMASTFCLFDPDAGPDTGALDPRIFATVTTLIAVLVLLMAIAAVLFDRRVQSETAMREEAMAAERRANEQLVQAQKMEAIGQLTGGVAHDFNNVLMIVLAHIDALRDDEGVSADVHPRLDKMTGTVQRAADLIRQLMAFSRKQILQPQETIVNDLVTGTSRLLRRTLGEHIRVEVNVEPALWTSNIDRAQVEAALLNLAVNARDAMPNGGRLVIETKNVTLDADYAGKNGDVQAGDYVMLSVTDTGMGMAPDVLQRVFEPFFTTKESGKGTGLGLSMVYGFIKQSNGHISIDSTIGQGTTVKLFFRRSSDDARIVANATMQTVQGGKERILLVEDEDSVRGLVFEQLRSLGYDVVSAASADDALTRLDDDAAFDLLLTDVVMPGQLNGKGLAIEVHRRWPGIRILFMSGYAESALMHDGKLESGVKLLSKPFRKADLARIVRGALDAANDTSPGPLFDRSIAAL
jgi:NO-binding membrane sensor protein with MHYT domain/nitrogen-specific signal transduction histidine kinase/CheY-like chemotaxis protein